MVVACLGDPGYLSELILVWELPHKANWVLVVLAQCGSGKSEWMRQALGGPARRSLAGRPLGSSQEVWGESARSALAGGRVGPSGQEAGPAQLTGSDKPLRAQPDI